MKTTTEYIQRTIIDTDDNGAVTIRRTYRADTLTEFLFSELAPEAQNRAIHDAIEEEQRDYWEGHGHTAWDIDEIWQAFADLAKRQPVQWHDHYSSFYLTVGDAEKVTPEEDSGICWSMDMCDAWNRYAAAVPLLIEEAEDHEATADEIAAPYYWPYCVAEYEPESVSVWFKAHEDYAEKCREKAEELAEKAKDALERSIKSLIEDVESYYASEDFWREWYTEDDYRFTREGERL